MNRLSQNRVVGMLTLTVVICLLSGPIFAQNKGKKANDATQHSKDAAKVFNEIMGAADQSIPKELVEKAQAIAVFPGVFKAAFIFGGREGMGVISRRTPAGWSAPAFFNLGGGSFGAQIGADKTDYVLLIMNEKGLNGLLGDKFQIGGEVSVAAGPVGREVSAATDAQLKAEILTYSRAKGAFAGLTLTGADVRRDNDSMDAFYGHDVSTHRVLRGEVATPRSADAFIDAVRQARARAIAEK